MILELLFDREIVSKSIKVADQSMHNLNLRMKDFQILIN